MIGRLLALTFFAMLPLASLQDARPAERALTIHALVPEGTGTVYITGSLAALGPWNPRGLAMTGSGRTRTAILRVPDGTELEYKFTLGSWDRESVGPSGTVMPNYRLKADADKEVTVELVDFKKDTAVYLDSWKESGVLGRLDYWKAVPSKFLPKTRNVEIWLPPGYDENAKARYPVVYMHDGQNLFDPRIANTGVDWGVDEAVVRGVEAGRLPSLIVVGVWSTEDRLREYSPWDEGPAYARFLVEELMPRVNAQYRTLTGPKNTATMGSSMGGLISFWLAWKHPDVFGRAGCMSTHWPWDGTLPEDPGVAPLILGELAKNEPFPKNVRLYFDHGTVGLDATYAPLQAKVDAFLASRGLKEGRDFVSRSFEGADHNETSWRARMDEPLAFLWNGYRPGR